MLPGCFPGVVKWWFLDIQGGVKAQIFGHLYGQNKKIGEPGGCHSTPKTTPADALDIDHIKGRDVHEAWHATHRGLLRHGSFVSSRLRV